MYNSIIIKQLIYIYYILLKKSVDIINDIKEEYILFFSFSLETLYYLIYK